MKNIFQLFIKVFLPLIFITACTQLFEEASPSSAYDGTDGCIYCHTNKARLKVLAQAETTTGGGGG